tara:strand:- start:49 stop:369 length:321 start_codon:yes stop_codon:yes gene_type:complete
MAKYYKNINGVRSPFTAEEEAARDAKIALWESKSGERKLAEIKQIRLRKLEETDWMANSDVTMSDAIKNYRQALRDIPANYDTESKYDELLARTNRKLTHSVWTKP